MQDDGRDSGREFEAPMKKLRRWKIIYAVCSLVYMGWMMHVGTNEFDRINSQYRRLNEQLDTDLIRSAALEELAADCRREAWGRTDLEEDACSVWAPSEVEARMQVVEDRFVRTRKRGAVKVVLFYSGFVIFFLVGPPVLIYLLLLGVIAIYKNIKFVR